MNDLVTRLAKGDHPVIISIRPEATLTALRECIDRGYVHVKFTDTRGGTEIGVRLDRGRSELKGSDFNSGSGTIHVVGNLTLDGEKVRCWAKIDLQTLAGLGHLEVLEEGVFASQS